jgi:hypothetical protein
MSIAKSVAAVQRTKQFQTLINAGLKLVSTERQLANGSLAFTGKLKSGRKTIRPSYVVTANGAVISNEFVARRVSGPTQVATYREGLNAVAEILSKRVAA